MHLTTSQAANLTGKNRSTIWRACKRGKLSASKTDAGDFLIDPAELERAFGSLQPRTTMQGGASHRGASTPATELLQQELAHTRELLERERALFDRDRRAWDDERSFLRRLVEQHTEQLRLVTHERADPAPEEQMEKPKAGVWRRLFRRA
jgi:hypothetical protein